MPGLTVTFFGTPSKPGWVRYAVQADADDDEVINSYTHRLFHMVSLIGIAEKAGQLQAFSAAIASALPVRADPDSGYNTTR